MFIEPRFVLVAVLCWITFAAVPREWRSYVLVGWSVVFYALCWQRYDTFHSRNFDLAFYARLSWGEAHHDAWEPIVDASVYGLHFVWLLEAVTWLGELIGHVRMLIVIQSMVVAALVIALWSTAFA